jgi:hypothetical protein
MRTLSGLLGISTIVRPMIAIARMPITMSQWNSWLHGAPTVHVAQARGGRIDRHRGAHLEVGEVTA